MKREPYCLFVFVTDPASNWILARNCESWCFPCTPWTSKEAPLFKAAGRGKKKKKKNVSKRALHFLFAVWFAMMVTGWSLTRSSPPFTVTIQRRKKEKVKPSVCLLHIERCLVHAWNVVCEAHVFNPPNKALSSLFIIKIQHPNFSDDVSSFSSCSYFCLSPFFFKQVKKKKKKYGREKRCLESLSGPFYLQDHLVNVPRWKAFLFFVMNN